MNELPATLSGILRRLWLRYKNWRFVRRLSAEDRRMCVCGEIYFYHNNDDDEDGWCTVCGCRKFMELELEKPR